MCIINFSTNANGSRKYEVDAMHFKFGRVLVVLLNVSLIMVICMIITEFYGVVLFRDGGYTEWSPFTPCTASCGGGVRHRRRVCANPEPTIGGRNCTRLGSSVEILTCNERGCPINGGFERWSNFGECSVTCGGGTHKRLRYCINPVPKFDGKDCKAQHLGPYEEERSCNEQPCAVNGGYSQWSDYAACSVSCGTGTKKRTRLCNNPTPIAGGKDCSSVGPNQETIHCSIECAVNGGYGEWTHWDKCTADCGGGSHTRTRACDSPPPSGGGKTCFEMGFGNKEDTKPCNTKPCNRKGGFGKWSQWSKCTVTCGGGRTERTRHCDNPKPSGKGKTCREQGLGSSVEVDECNTQDCT